MDDNALRFGHRDPELDARVESLLGQMTLEEKVGQMVQINPFAGIDLEDAIKKGAVGTLLSVTDVADVNRLQRVAVEESRLGIPLIIGNDVIHGHRTIFPIPLAEACTWEPDLLRRAERVASVEASACGTDWIFAPMIDVSREPRWGRIAEGSGEDQFLGSAIAEAKVRGFQAGDLETGRRVVACPKHYVAYGGAEAGRDYNTVDISERTLREVYLPPFKAAFEAGAGSVMSSFNEIGGVPATCNTFTLRTILKDEWGFDGVVVLSDYNAVAELIHHGVAGDLKEAARLSVLAGLDIDMMAHSYSAHLADLVNEGAVPIDVIEEAVRRILRLKVQLGLFENPYTDEALPEKFILREDFRELALEVAQKSMVLLKNDGAVLPLPQDIKRVALIGPLADDHAAVLGCWAVAGKPEDAESVLDGVKSYVDGERLTHVQGCAVEGDEGLDIDAAVEAARAADVTVLVLGEDADMSGEAHSRAHIGLPGSQQELLDAVCATGKPVVVVLMSGRPLVIPKMVEQVPAILLAWHGGIRAGRAIADALFGTVNPSGKLTVTFPRAEGQIPIYYSRKNTGRPPESAGTTQFEDPFRSTYLDEPTTPLFPFGYGLSYTRFEYSNLKVETPTVGRKGTVVVSATVRNSGERAGDEIVHLYVHDVVGSTTPPVKELKGFRKITLQPGEEQQVSFEVPTGTLGRYGLDMKYAVEPGDFKVWVGPNSAEGLEGEFKVE